jgi:suppressor for copper-sensitivity B
MLLVLGLFTLNMLDRFFLPIPAFLQASFRGDGQNTNGQNISSRARPAILFGDFMAGMLATLLATPCSAPFVGSAVTVALTGDMAQLFAVFMAMGAGLAAPWGLVVLFPALVGFLPRPGHWMVWLKRGLAGLLIATMIWLGWLLQTIQGGQAALLLFGLVGFVLLASFIPSKNWGFCWLGLAFLRVSHFCPHLQPLHRRPMGLSGRFGQMTLVRLPAPKASWSLSM